MTPDPSLFKTPNGFKNVSSFIVAIIRKPLEGTSHFDTSEQGKREARCAHNYSTTPPHRSTDNKGENHCNTSTSSSMWLDSDLVIGKFDKIIVTIYLP